MSTKPKRWSDYLAAMPKLTKAQADAVKHIVDYRLAHLTSDYPRIDDEHYSIQIDLDAITAPAPAKEREG